MGNMNNIYFYNTTCNYSYRDFCDDISEWGTVEAIYNTNGGLNKAFLIKFKNKIDSNVLTTKGNLVNLTGGHGISNSSFFLRGIDNERVFGNEYMLVDPKPERHIFFGNKANNLELYHRLKSFLEKNNEDLSILSVFGNTTQEEWDIFESSPYSSMPESFGLDKNNVTADQTRQLIKIHFRQFGNNIQTNGFYRNGNDKCCQPSINKIRNCYKNLGWRKVM